MLSISANKIFLLLASVAGSLGLITSLTNVVSNKPYGVPDARREEYDQILIGLNENQKAIQTVKRTSEAVARIAEKQHDFGFVDPGAEGLRHDFVISNAGTGPLLLSSKGSSCKCTVAEIADRIVPPGESTAVTLVWNVGTEVNDDYQQSAFIETNDPNAKELELVVSGKVRSKYACSSSGLKELKGDFGAMIEASCFVTSQLFDEFVIFDVETSSPNVSVEFQPEENLESIDLRARSGFRVNVQYRAPNEQTRSFDETIRLHVMSPDDTEPATIVVPVSGTINRPVTFIGPEIDLAGLELGTIEIGTDQTWAFSVRFNTDETVTKPIVKAVVPEGLIARIEPSLRVRNTFRVVVSVAKTASPVTFRFKEQGYIEIADSENPARSNWMPLLGQLIDKP